MKIEVNNLQQSLFILFPRIVRICLKKIKSESAGTEQTCIYKLK